MLAVREEYADEYDDRADDLERREHLMQEDDAGDDGNDRRQIREDGRFGNGHAHRPVVQADERRNRRDDGEVQDGNDELRLCIAIAIVVTFIYEYGYQ